DDDVVHLDDEELELTLARLAVGDGRFLEVLAGRARAHQRGRGLVDLMGNRQIPERRLARSTAVDVARIASAPGVRQDFDLVLVLVVDRLALDVPELGKDISRHQRAPCIWAGEAFTNPVRSVWTSRTQ